MSDIAEFETRISAALERIGQAAEALSSGAAEEGVPDTAALDAAQEALEAERITNAQLEERVKAIREKQDSQVQALEDRVAALDTRAEQAEGELAKLRRVNAELRANNTALREANAAGLGDAHLINKSMQAELETLRTLRDGDRAELDDILGTLAPLTGEATHA